MIFNGSLSALTRKSIFAIFLAFASLAHAELSGSVVAILDGDTIDVLVDRNPVRVRLAQIDAPEKRQAFGYAIQADALAVGIPKNGPSCR